MRARIVGVVLTMAVALGIVLGTGYGEASAAQRNPVGKAWGVCKVQERKADRVKCSQLRDLRKLRKATREESRWYSDGRTSTCAWYQGKLMHKGTAYYFCRDGRVYST